ncbi:MAG: DUF2330 domain-containing protein [Archangium sp.]
MMRIISFARSPHAVGNGVLSAAPRLALSLASFAALTFATAAHAFCGFYVAGGGAELFNNATQVVLMREGTRTVLSMQNNYQGPPSDFAMVIPVPVVLKKENVKTLSKDIFTRVDQLTAPRLVEYWEQDPCWVEPKYDRESRVYAEDDGAERKKVEKPKDLGVKIEAQFTVGEYEIVVLSAKDALGLDTWLKQNKYKIPEGAEPLFRPYIQQGMKFFVAKVDVKKVKFDEKTGMANLSPLRFHYDSEKFELPVRLGLINAKTQQDLIVNILGKNQRYEVANYKNVTIPTNIDLVPSAKSEFPFFYVSLFDRTLKSNPGSVVTEYAWQASSCDPCPTTPLSAADFQTLGADAIPSKGAVKDPYNPAESFVLTRLHARYDKTSLGEDLGVQGREADRRWPRVPHRRQEPRAGLQRRLVEQLPGALRDSLPVDRGSEVQGAGVGALGWAAVGSAAGRHAGRAGHRVRGT